MHFFPLDSNTPAAHPPPADGQAPSVSNGLRGGSTAPAIEISNGRAASYRCPLGSSSSQPRMSCIAAPGITAAAAALAASAMVYSVKTIDDTKLKASEGNNL